MRSKDVIIRANDYEDIILERSSGCWAWDTEGNRYLDMESGIWCCNLGHGHPEVVKAAEEQMHKNIHIGSRFLSSTTLEAAGALLDFMPGNFDRATFLSSGSEAVEMAISLARLYTGRNTLLSFDHAYLGAYGSSAGASGQAACDGCMKIPVIKSSGQKCSSCTYVDDCREILRVVESSAESIACFVFEPILVSGGVIRPCSEMIRKICSIVRSAGGLVVVDEVTTGFGRTGERFSYVHHSIEPDIVALGKALGNGFPVSAVVTKAGIEKLCFEKGFYYVQSHQLDPIGCAIAKKVVEVFSSSNITGESKAKSEEIMRFLNDNKKGFIKDIRSEGLAFAIEPCDYNGIKADEYLNLLKDRLQENGVLIGISRKHGVARMLPPLTITEDELEFFKQAYLKSLDTLSHDP